MTETLEKKGMTLITDSFVCRTLQFQERLEKLLYDIHTEFPEKVYSLELLFEKFSGFLKTDMDDGGRFDALIKATNLSLESLANLYTERSFSRITSSYALLKIIGDDIRIKKKLKNREVH